MCVLTPRWRRLKAQMIEKRSKLGESQSLQQFSRDVDEIEAWISEKLQTATDESYKDPTNIQVQLHSVVNLIDLSFSKYDQNVEYCTFYLYLELDYSQWCVFIFLFYF